MSAPRDCTDRRVGLSRAPALLPALIFFLLAGGTPAGAHPLGNDSITHFNVLYVLPDRLELDYLLDIAENPTQFIESGEMDADQDGQVSRREQEAWVDRKVGEFAAFLKADLDGAALPLSLVPEEVDAATGRKLTTSKVIVPMLGPMGMTYRLVIRYAARYPAPLGPGEHVITYEDQTYPQHVGLKLVLLQPVPAVCRLYDLSTDGLAAGPVPESVRTALSDEGIELESPRSARLQEAGAAFDPGAARPGTTGSLDASGGRDAGPPAARWRLTDGDRQFALADGPDGIDVFVIPYCRILGPHPPFVSEDHAAFRYEQYDPMNLPDVRSATVRFTVVDAVSSEAPGGAGGAAAATGPAMASAGQASSRPASAQSLPLHAADFLDPGYNPIQMGKYQRQASRMIGLLQGRWGILLFLVITGTAFAWGAAHALMPGHAKTVVAAYLISQRGTYRHAVMLAVIVTVTHTALVVIMGLVIWVYQRSHPRLGAQLQLWLGLTAGLLVAGMGLALIWRAATGRLGSHAHDHSHDHSHGDERRWWSKLLTHSHPHVPHADSAAEHVHPHGHHHHAHDPEHVHSHDHAHSHEPAHSHVHVHSHEHSHPHERHGEHDQGSVDGRSSAGGHGPEQHEPAHRHDHFSPHPHEHRSEQDRPRPARAAAAAGRQGGPDQLSFQTLLVLGITGGIVPCPSATIIMFLGIGANVVGGALYAIAIFSLGLALTLMIIGSLALTSRRFAARIMSDARSEQSGQELSGAGRRILLQIVPVFSGLVVVCLGAMIATHYLCLMRNVPSPFPWMG